jgi:hypothetical protein
MIRLQPFQTKARAFSHPLLGGHQPKTEEELQELRDDPDALVLGLFSSLRHLVGRFLQYYPQTAQFLDDMVSEGVAVLIKLSKDPPKDILHTANRRMEDVIESYLSVNIVASAPSLWKQKELSKEGADPRIATSIGKMPEKWHPHDDGDYDVRDVLDAVSHIEPKDAVDDELLDKINWGKSNVEMAAELGVSEATIRARRQELYNQYLSLTE